MRFSSVFELNRNKIVTDPSRFQGRLSDYSQDTVNAIVAKGTYDKSGEPIIVWHDPALDKYIVISGHSRFEATRRLFEAGNNDLETIPVKEFLGTQDEAIDYAVLESNRGSTEEGLISDLNAYRRAVEQGRNKQFLLSIFKPESKLRKLQNLYFLNPRGKFIEYLGSESSVSFPYLERNAQWVGQIRSQLPAITDLHESEIFDYLYGDKKAMNIAKDKFFDLINKRVNRLDFDPEKALNLKDRPSSNVYTDPINDQIKELDKEIEKIKKEVEEKQNLIIRAKNEGKTEFIPKFQQRITDLNGLILRKIEEREKLRQAIGRIERETVVDLFSMEDLPEPKPEEKPKKITWNEFYDQTAELLSEKWEITRSDSQAYLDANWEDQMKDAWNMGKSPEYFISLIDQESIKEKSFEPKSRGKLRMKHKSRGKLKTDSKDEALKDELKATLKEAREIESHRTKQAKKLDEKKTAQTVRLPTKENLKTWKKDPGASDIIGVDTKPGDLPKPTLKRDRDILDRIGDFIDYLLDPNS